MLKEHFLTGAQIEKKRKKGYKFASKPLEIKQKKKKEKRETKGNRYSEMTSK